MSHYFYSHQGQRRGPVSEPALADLRRNRVIDDATLVWTQGMADWKPLGEVIPASPDHSGGDEALARCAVSGQWASKAEMVPFGSDWVLPAFRDRYLQRIQHGPSGPTGELVTAGAWRRIGAVILDSLLFWGVPVFAVAMLVAFLDGAETLDSDGTDTLVGFGMMIFACVAEVTCVSLWRSTPAKLLLGMEIVAMDGQPLTFGQNLGRAASKYLLINLCGILGIVSLIQFLTDRNLRQALHDRMAKARVVLRRRAAT